MPIFFVSNGTTASGLFVAASFLIELIKVENVCDISLAVRTVKQFDKEFICSKVST